MTETKQKILDTAERLFGQQGYAATSLRHIIAEAGVNLAAIHYHYGSKEELLDEVVMRKAGPLNEERLALLDRYEAEAGPGPLAVEKVLEAFLAPAFSVADRSPKFVTLMGRMYGEGLMPMIVKKHFQPMAARFMGAFRRALPDVPNEELAWRIHFMIGTMAHTLCGSPDIRAVMSGEAPPSDPQRVVQRLVTFLGAGFRAPASRAAESEEK
jgi:AcrR family transcriptional regulator